ncbi:DEAD/DEAH box helicase [Antribacter gilvus]|uniref:DEAD/DEAH box helicase n=1 Tax=Antribacter gilvus TaxID=2304675 RepID=UPI0013E009AD|nr:DEAD/DEAH box helicase [Antribacter gilvus]
MVLPASPPSLDAAAVRRLVGAAAYERGLDYQRSGRVLDWTWRARTRELGARVRGSGRSVYTCLVTFDVARSGRYEVIAADCSCPVGTDCKHVAATLIESGVAAEEDPAEAAGHPRRATWRDALGRVTAGPAPGAAGGDLTAGLRVRLTGASAVLPGAPPPAIAVRPALRTGSARWTAGSEASWDRLRYGYGLPLGPQVREWFAELADLAANRGGRYRLPAWVDLEDLGRAVWTHLEQAADLGIELVGAAKGETVRLARQAEVVAEASSTGDGGLRLAPALRFDGVRVAASAFGAAGPAGLFAVEPHDGGQVLLLGPVRGALTVPQRELLALPETVVPPADVPEFLGEVYPSLRRRVGVRSDGTVDLPEPPRPVLVAHVRYESPARAGVSWEWEYGSARRPFGPDDADPLRDPGLERAILGRVEDAVRQADGFGGFAVAEARDFLGLAALDLTRSVVPVLRGLGDVRVDAEDVPAYAELDQRPVVGLAAAATNDHDWVDLQLSVRVDGREIPFRPLFEALVRGTGRLLLVDGSWMRTDRPVFDKLRDLIDEAKRLSDNPTTLRLSRYQAGLWGELEEVADVVEQSDAWRRSVGDLLALVRSGESPGDDPLTTAVPVPVGLKAELRPYQQHGFEWLTFLWERGLGGILADDMGLGKTVETLAFLAHARAESPAASPFLVVAPASVVSNWAAEAERFTPDLRVVVLPTTAAKAGTTVAEAAAGADVVVTSYAIFRLDFEAFADVAWSGLVLDEAQFAKNHQTRANECARRLRAPFKVAITGTPLENNLMELWAMLAIVAPGLFPSAGRFRLEYVRPVEAAARDAALSPGARDASVARAGAATLARLRRRVRPLLLRRTKEQVAPELPARQEQVLRVTLDPRHRRVYDTHLQRERSRMLGLLTDFDANRVAIFRALTTLRRLALDATLVDPVAYRGVRSAKLEVLEEQLVELAAEGHRALVFSQFTSFLQRAADRCRQAGLDVEYLDGSTTDRAEVIRRFKDGTAPVFLISLKAGGFGLNLTEADYVYLLDPWWNPATEAQAIDRTHRIGQTRNVMVFRLVSEGTVEEKVMALKQRKAQLFDAVLGDDEGVFSASLSADDVRGLLDAI